jgi:hypothetical protein
MVNGLTLEQIEQMNCCLSHEIVKNYLGVLSSKKSKPQSVKVYVAKKREAKLMSKRV